MMEWKADLERRELVQKMLNIETIVKTKIGNELNVIEFKKRKFANSPSFSMIGNWVNSNSSQWEKRRTTVWGQPEGRSSV